MNKPKISPLRGTSNMEHTLILITHTSILSHTHTHKHESIQKVLNLQPICTSWNLAQNLQVNTFNHKNLDDFE